MYAMLFLVFITIVMLFIAASVGFPSYSYYSILRLITFISASFSAFTAYVLPLNKAFIYIYAAVAILFNPLFIVRLDKTVWQNIDIVVGILLMYVLYSVAKDSGKAIKHTKTILVLVGAALLTLLCIINGNGIEQTLTAVGSFVLAMLLSFGVYYMPKQYFDRKNVPGQSQICVVKFHRHPMSSLLFFAVLSFTDFRNYNTPYEKTCQRISVKFFDTSCFSSLFRI